MHTRLLSESIIRILTAPEQWRIVSSRFAPEIVPVHDARHEEWMESRSLGHVHQEILMVLAGEARYSFQGKVYPCKPGDIFIFDSFEEHDSDYPAWTRDSTHLWMYFAGESVMIRVFDLEDGSYQSRQVISDLAKIARTPIVTRHLFATPSDAALPEGVARFLTFSALCSLVCALIEIDSEPQDQDDVSFSRRVIELIRAHIQKTSGKGIDLDGLAHFSGYSKFHVERLFTQYTGQSVHKFIDDCRKTKVSQMLSEGRSKKEISNALGFSCQSSFSRWYKARK